MMRSLAVLMMLAAGIASAQIPADKDALLAGDAAGQAKFAEANGYPGPKQVLDLGAVLNLTADQKRRVSEIYKATDARARELGKRIVRVEDELNTAFRQGLVSERSVNDDAEQIGRLRGKLRAVHLTARMRTKDVLTRAQIDMMKSMRSKDDADQHKH